MFFDAAATLHLPFAPTADHKTDQDCADCIKMVSDVCTYLEDSEVTIAGVKFYGSTVALLPCAVSLNFSRIPQLEGLHRHAHPRPPCGMPYVVLPNVDRGLIGACNPL